MTLLTRMMLYRKRMSMNVERNMKVPRTNKMMPMLQLQMTKSKTNTMRKKVKNEKRKRKRTRM